MVRKGFTLIELLVVIAIIAILAAILFPVFTSAKKSAFQASCLSNTKQISYGFMLYLQNNNDGFPAGILCQPGTFWDPKAKSNYVRAKRGMPGATYITSDGTNSGNYTSWMDAIYPYIKNMNAFTCPSIRDRTIKWTPTSKESNYGYNPAISGFLYCANPVLSSAIKRSASFVMVYDYGSPMGPCADGFWVASAVKDSVSRNLIYGAPHNEGLNIGFADGHARWVKGTDPLITEGTDHCPGTSPHWWIAADGKNR